MKGTLTEKGKGVTASLSGDVVRQGLNLGALAMTSEASRSWTAPYLMLTIMGFAKGAPHKKYALRPYADIYLPAPEGGAADVQGFGDVLRDMTQGTTVTKEHLQDVYKVYPEFFDAAREYLKNKDFSKYKRPSFYQTIPTLAAGDKAEVVEAFSLYVRFLQNNYQHLPQR